MSDLFIKNIPSIEKKEFKYRSKMNSHDLNSLQDEAFQDILDLFNKANMLQKTVYELQMAHGAETACYEYRVNEAVKELNTLRNNYQNLRLDDSEYREKTVYAFDAYTADDTYGALIDKHSNSIIPSIVTSVSKMRIYDEAYDEYLIPESLQAFIGPDSFREGGDIYSIEDSEVRNAFDGKYETTWLRKIITSTNVEEVEQEITIGLPEDIITTRLMNELLVCPFPSGYIDIVGIYYRSNGAWTMVPGFESHQGYTTELKYDAFGNAKEYSYISEAIDMRFNFPAVQTNQIKIKFRQKNYENDQENNRRIFYVGLRDVNACYNTYANYPSTFDMVFDFSETQRSIQIYDVIPEFNNANISDDDNFGISKEYYYYDAQGFTHKIGDSLPFILRGHKMRVQFSTDGSQNIPNVRSATVKYKIVDPDA